MFFLLEVGAALAALAAAFAFPSAAADAFARLEDLLSRLAKRRAISVLTIMLAAIGVRAALLPVEPIPVPGVQDEFSQLLAADTFAHGRLTNPPHPMWVHFETLSVIQQPTYQSKYPPAPPLLMAAGERFAGHPFWGVLLGVGLMCGAICWMLQGWLPESWALLGGFLAIIRFGSFSYWADSYWGGAVAAFAGALILGALPRIKKDQKIRDAVIMALGLAVLADTRPYEGLCFAAPVLIALLWWFFRQDRAVWAPNALRIAAPMLVVLIAAAAATGYYFHQVTGSAFRMPYQVYQQTYDPMPNFIWQHAGPLPTYRHKVMLAWELTRTSEWGGRTAGGFLATCLQRMIELSLFYLDPLFGLILFAALAVAPRNLKWKQLTDDVRFFVLLIAISFASYMVEHSAIPHYLAQATCVALALILLAVRFVRQCTWKGAQVGLALTRNVVVACVILFCLRALAAPLHIPIIFPAATWFGVSGQDGQNLDRARISSQLQAMPGRHLIFVQYSAPHFRTIASVGREWVYNAADIDASKVVWAQDMGLDKNQELIDYYKDRHIWLVLPDETPPRLVPYSTNADASVAAQGAGNAVTSKTSLQSKSRPARPALRLPATQ